ncbi:hypothetical protein F5148DRAFT_1219879 [Russula earlei]|uniref:Uncharacterized protein n=1 Tax=Russula earlei TaxID=71964 RepID=A0ACC0U230_9AGAM|nr:hypothetical protein F5148DRAFT_1219879 [Russula earlei]
MSSSSPSAPTSKRDQQILAVGRQCSHPSCHLVDFLPFKCQHCANSFCADHFKPASHSCAKYDEAKFNRVAPDCPLCNDPVPIPPGEDPNIRMERHLTMDCSVMTGRSQKANTTPKCARPKCGKLLFAQIQCDKCHQKFCPEHRFPSSHNCASISSTPGPPSANIATKPSSHSPAISASGIAALKRAAASVKSSASPPTIPSKAPPPTKEAAPPSGVVASSSKTNPSLPKPFSKTERSSTLTKPGATSPTNHTHATTDIPDHHSPKFLPHSLIDSTSFIPRPLFASAS